MTVKLLYINACPRPEGVSRTRRLADVFWDLAARAGRRYDITTHDVPLMRLAPLDGGSLAGREALIDRRQWTEPVFAPAMDLLRADRLVIAAPYWDLMFPAMLKTYIEHVFIRELTFRYEDDAPIGLCRAERALFLTTAGGRIGENDFGTEYLRATLAMLGIERLDSVKMDGVDMRGADVEASFAEATAALSRLIDLY